MAEAPASGSGGRTRDEWLLAAEAALSLAGAAVALRVLSFARLAALASGEGAERLVLSPAWLRPPSLPQEPRTRKEAPSSAPEAAIEEEAARIGWAVRAAAARAPWRAMCLERGLAAHFMLRRRGRASILYYGARAAGGLDAHVWVRLGDADVVGGEEAAAYAVLATFPPRA
jgi:hypothetical protein